MSAEVNQAGYVTGGPVQANDGLYLERPADEKLLALCRKGAFVYILTSRQMGKSSLMFRTKEQLVTENIRSAVIDLQQFGTNSTAEQWYFGLLAEIEGELGLETDAARWWQANAHLGFTHRLTKFFREVLLQEVKESIVVFMDEIDTTLNLKYSDDFFAAIRYFYNARATTPDFRRLSFVLIGVATPSDLIRDPQRTPFNIGQRLDLTDFTAAEAAPLTDGLRLPLADAKRVLDWVLDWTNGHPYLTQRLCKALADEERGQWTKVEVDQMVEQLFFGEQAEQDAQSGQDSNLDFVRAMLTERVPDKYGVLKTYRDVLRGHRQVPDEKQSLIKSHLKLAGLVRSANGILLVRNRIYKEVFNEQWLTKQNLTVEVRFVAGGIVQAGSGTYLSRSADEHLLTLCREGEFAFVLTPRQTGKSSLMFNTLRGLASEGIQSVVIDLSGWGINITPEQWCRNLLHEIVDQLDLEVDLIAWWEAQAHLGPTQRLALFLREMVLKELPAPARIVLFVDEIDSALSLRDPRTGTRFTDDFFAAIRVLYNERAISPDLERLTFVVMGCAKPDELVQDPSRTPFIFGHRVELEDFTYEQILPLAAGLNLPQDEAEEVLKSVFYWANGHPFLTQRLCQELNDQQAKGLTGKDVAAVVQEIFFGEMGEWISNIAFVRDTLTRPDRVPNGDVESVLEIYREILAEKKPVIDEERSQIKSHLKLVGVVRREGDYLQVRNRIYKTIFDDRWARTQLPIRQRYPFLKTATDLIKALITRKSA